MHYCMRDIELLVLRAVGSELLMCCTASLSQPVATAVCRNLENDSDMDVGCELADEGRTFTSQVTVLLYQNTARLMTAML